MKKLRPYQAKAVKECWDALRKNDEPVLLMASVGAGKSLMIADMLIKMQHIDKRALCIVNNAELVRNNSATLIDEGGKASIYCAALKEKDCTANIVFGTPLSILNAINKNETIAKIKFNIIIVDEAHTINYNNDRSAFMRILRYYKHEYPSMRLLGATGTNFRFKGTAIVGKDCLFKSQVGDITTDYLLAKNYLVAPEFEVNKDLVIDFSKVKIKSNGQFDQKDLQHVVSQNARLTELICKQIIHIMESQNRFGVFLFATTKKHAYEIMSHMPPEDSALILGDTPQDERTDILNKARIGEIKYLVNISIISVGVDIPAYDTLAYLRPTESLVLLVQTMGRVLRLSPDTDKESSLVLDFAGNIERHQHWDNPLLLAALKQTLDKDKPWVIQCPQCMQMNTDTSRRCVGVTHEIRCEYYFEFKECDHCGIHNDISARNCRNCNNEIIDPNTKLSMDTLKNGAFEVAVLEARYGISGTRDCFKINCSYKCEDIDGHLRGVYEFYVPKSPRAINVFYGKFVKPHCSKSSEYYPYLNNRNKMEEMLQEIGTPGMLHITEAIDGEYKIKKKIFKEKEYERPK